MAGCCASSTSIVVWMQRNISYVENMRSLILRIKHPSKFGESVLGISEKSGDLIDVQWGSIMNLRPTVMEFTQSRNPLHQLTSVLRSIPEDELSEFLSRIKLIYLDTTDINAEDLHFILKRLKLLLAFSFTDVSFTKTDWELLLPEFKRLSIRAMEISRNIFNTVLDKLDLELLKFTGGPGIRISALKECTSTFVTVRTLIAQELDYSYDQDAENLITCVQTKFPHLKTFVMDWSIADPAVTIDDRLKAIITSLVALFEKMRLECMGVIAYTPCSDTKYATGEMARFFSESGLPSVQLFRFASRGLSKGQENFTVIIAGNDYNARNKIHSIYVEGRTSSPDLRHCLQLLDDNTPPFPSATIVEFGGFDEEYVRNAYESRLA